MRFVNLFSIVSYMRRDSREVIKADVFRPRMEGPSMTLEEFADIELAQALERQKAERDRPNTETRRYKQLLADGEEDNEELLDQVYFDFMNSQNIENKPFLLQR